MKHYDIVIVGAGIAGSALAASLSQLTVGRPLTIAIVERRPVPQGCPPLNDDVSGFDLRASALTNATIQWLDKIGAWPEVKNQRASAFAEMDVWVEEGTGHIHFSAGEVGESALGEIVENRVLTSTLLNMARGSPNVTVIDDVEVTGLELLAVSGQPQAEGSAQTVTLQLADGSAISAALVVAADGAASPVRTMSNIPVRAWDYGQDGIVCTVISEKPHRATAYQRFTRYGPVAFLPFESDNPDACVSSIVWSQDKARAAELMALDDNSFKQELAAAIEYRLGAITECSQRLSFPLRQMHANEYTRPGLVLVADAAHTIHPLAGQGINLGLADVAELVQTLEEALEKGKALSDVRLLKRYQRRRKTDNLAMMALMEGFKRIYRPLPLPAMLARNEGMNMLQRHTLLKRQVIRYAMGVQR